MSDPWEEPGSVSYSETGRLNLRDVVAHMTLTEFQKKFPSAKSIGRNTMAEDDAYQYIFRAPDPVGPGCHYLRIEVPFDRR